MTRITALFFIISLVCVIGFVMFRDELVAQPKALPQPTLKKEKTSTQGLPRVSPQSQESVLKIAVPDGQRVELIDMQGRTSGITLTGLRNDIPQSECRPDEMLGTVTWILLSPPQETAYTLKVTGASDKAIAVYLKNTSGFEGLELIETKDHDAQREYTYMIQLDHESAQHIIGITEK